MSLTAIVPMATLTLVSPAVLPVVTVPWLVVTEPAARVVLASGVSLKTTASASTGPVFSMTTV